MQSIEITYSILALVIWIAGYLHTGKFVKPKWKIPGKFIFYVVVSWAISHWFGHWALVFVIGHPLLGLGFHINACKKNSINWVTCEPKEKYIALTEKWAKGDFSNEKD
ncbi:MAG: hypothetical protein JXQ87_18065 [Bacteroidia bacterium]